MRELDGDVASADEGDAGAQAVVRHEPLAVDDQLGSGDAEGRRVRPGGDHDVPGPERLISDTYRLGIDEGCGAVEGGHSGRGQPLLDAGRRRVGERPLEGDQRGPVDGHVSDDAAGRLAASALHRLGGIEQHLLRLAAAQRAGSTELAPIDRGHTLAGGRERRGRGLPRNAGPDDDDVETLHGRLLVW